jgi:predicted Rossmann fold nucleotide-binding protein DprA/Smf involved in DNA uptake
MSYAEAVYWLTLINEHSLKLNLVKTIIQRWCVLEQRTVADLFDLSPLEWSTTFGLSSEEGERAASLNHKLEAQAKAMAHWQAQGIDVLLRTDPRYPRRLAQLLPPAQQPLLLWGQGDLSLLNEPAVAVLGNESTGPTATFIDELMQVLVDETIGLVSGYSRGLDRSTFETMLTTPGGRAIAIIPMGLSAFAQTTSKLAQAIQTGRIALISPFVPDTTFNEKFADARNLLIDYLALTLLVLDTDDDALARATVALERNLPVLVHPADNEVTRTLIDKGAFLLTDPGEVIEMAQQAMIDDTMLEETPEPGPIYQPLAPVSPPVLPDNSTDDYTLHTEELEPIDSDEALEILSMGGDVPEILRKRLEESEEEE